MVGVLDACTEHQPSLAVTGQLDHLAHNPLVVVVGIDCGLQLGFDELPATLVHASCVQFGLGDLAAQGGQVTLEDQLLDGHRLDQGVK